MKKVDMNELQAEIVAQLKEYGDVCTEDIKEAVKKTAKDCVKEIKAKSPSDTGEYRRGWRQATMFENANEIRIDVYNAKKPQLTHLLEFGHIVRNRPGGAILGKAGAHAHIRPAELKAQKELVKKIEKAVKG